MAWEAGSGRKTLPLSSAFAAHGLVFFVVVLPAIENGRHPGSGSCATAPAKSPRASSPTRISPASTLLQASFLVVAPSRISVKAPALYGVGLLLSWRPPYIPHELAPVAREVGSTLLHPGRPRREGGGSLGAVPVLFLSASIAASMVVLSASGRRSPRWFGGYTAGAAPERGEGEAGIGAWRSARSRAGRPRRGPTGPRPAW
jgi:hypothetical protein